MNILNESERIAFIMIEYSNNHFQLIISLIALVITGVLESFYN